MKVGETLRRAGVGDRAPSAMTSSIKHDAAEEVRPRDFSWFRRLTTIMTWPPIGGARAGYFMKRNEVHLRQKPKSETCDKLTLIGSVIPLTRNPVDPAGGYRYWSSIKPCESRGFGLGVPLSNTWVTCPMLGNNLGKLRIMPHSPLRLER